MQTDWVGTVGRAGAEDALAGTAGVVARVDGEDVAIGAIEPGEDQQLVSDREVRGGLGDAGVECDPGLGGALVALFRRRRGVAQRRLDPTDRPQLDRLAGYGAPSISYSRRKPSKRRRCACSSRRIAIVMSWVTGSTWSVSSTIRV